MVEVASHLNIFAVASAATLRGRSAIDFDKRNDFFSTVKKLSVIIVFVTMV